MKNKLVSIFLLVILVFNCIPVFAANGITISSQTGGSVSNQTNTVDGNISTYAQFFPDVNYDTKLWVNVPAGSTKLSVLVSSTSGSQGSYVKLFTYNNTATQTFTVPPGLSPNTYTLNIPNDTTLACVDLPNGGISIDVYEISTDPGSISPAPTTPPTVTATPGNGQITLTWNAVQNATSYTITQVGGSTITGITGTTYTVTGLHNGQSYSFYMAAVNANGTSTNSNTVSATPAAPIPAAPTGLTGSAGNGQVSLSWNATPNAEYGYNVYQDGKKINTSYVTATSYNITGLTNGTSHSYTVTSVSSGGESPQSNTVSLTPTLAIPAAPTQLAATASNATINLQWTSVSLADSYNVYQDGVKINTAPVSSTTFAITSGLTNGQTYTYQITAVNASGESPKSSPVTATPKQPAPAVNGSTDNASVTLSWSAIPNVSSYNVYQDGVKVLTTTATTATINGLQNDKTYSFTVTSTSGGSESAPSAPVALTPSSAVPVPAQNIKLNGTPGGNVTLTWTVTNPPGQQTYTIYQNGQSLGTTTANTITLPNYNPNSPYVIVAKYGDKTVSSQVGGVIQSSPNKWGFFAEDIFSNSVNLVMSVAGFILLFLIFLFAPRLFEIVKKAILKGNYRQYKSGVKKSYRYDGERWNYQYTDDLGRDWYKTGSGSWDKGSFLDRASKDIKTDWIDKT